MATFTTYPLGGSSFFSTLRKSMSSGFFAGKDGSLWYVVMDAAFFKFEVYRRPANRTFAGGAEDLEALHPSIRAVVNGQHCNSYNLGPSPGPQTWQGEIIEGHTVTTGTPGSYPTHMYFGQRDGQTEKAFEVGRGNPSTQTTPTGFNNAMGRLLPIVHDRVRYGDTAEKDPVTGAEKRRFSGGIADWTHEWKWTGKLIVGIHRQSQSLFALVQQHPGPAGGLFPAGHPITEIVDLVADMGVDDAVMADGSTSVSLIVDGVSEIYPTVLYKNNSITTGFAFHQQWLAILPTAGAKLTVRSSTDPQFSQGFVAQGATGAVEIQPAGGVSITLGSLGTATGYTSQQLAAALDVTLPLKLTATTLNITGSEWYSGTNSSAYVRLVGEATSAGRIKGDLRLKDTRGDVTFDVDWPVTASNVD